MDGTDGRKADPIEKLETATPDLSRQNAKRIAELFPEVVTEGPEGDGPHIDFDLLRQALSDHLVEGPAERYRLDWPGKRQAMLLANTPTTKTLRPVREDSVDFDTTRNLFIEGDNLEALKILQETYLGQVKMIYIDPPYNTGKDFIYRDNFRRSAGEELEASGQVDEDGRLVANTEANGRFHSDWLSMMAPRLKLARSLLRDDGVIFVSIDDAEQQGMRFLLDEVFGEQNFVAQLVWEKGRKNDATLFSSGHEYVLIYGKSIARLKELKTVWREEKPGARDIWEEYERLREELGDADDKVEKRLKAWFSSLPRSDPAKKWARYSKVDRFGPWRDGDVSWPGGDGPRYEVIHPKTKLPCKVPEAGWRFSESETMQKYIDKGLVVFRDDHTEPPFRKRHLRPLDFDVLLADGEEDEDDESSELAVQVRGTYFYKQSQVSVKYLRDLMGKKVFTNPKDQEELARLVEYVQPQPNDIILDFFSGSGSTADAVMRTSANLKHHLRYFAIQLPEALEDVRGSETGTAKKTAGNAIAMMSSLGEPLTISALARERIRRAGAKILAENPDLKGTLDVGFRAFRIDGSSFHDIRLTVADAAAVATDDERRADLLDGLTSHIKDDRSDEDLLFGALLAWGVDITLPVRRETVEGRAVLLVDAPEDGAEGAVLIACFARDVDVDLAAALAALRPLRVVFRDDGFLDDATKENVASRFNQLAPDTTLRVL